MKVLFLSPDGTTCYGKISMCIKTTVLIHLITTWFICWLVAGSPQPLAAQEPPDLSVMAWNIWHGGREDGEQIGPQKVIQIIRDSQVDLVAMQETYGSGELISEALQFHFHPRGTNVSIHSRWPVVEDLSVFEPFKCVGALIELPDKRRVAFYSIWLPYNNDVWVDGSRDPNDVEKMLQACEASRADLQTIKQQIHERLDQPQYADVPIIIAGDFNSMSHRDYIESATDQYGVVVDWPTSHVLADEGYRDAWRETRPEVDRTADRTWSPRFTEQEQDRIDFVYYRGGGLQATDSQRIDSYQDGFPSDHAAVVTRFDWPPITAENQLRTVTYNIRHGLGTDDRLDLDRAAEVL
ncbi:MAG: endonuclease/exonuclease/phosphatase family protein [Pirellulaceae bacterium]